MKLSKTARLILVCGLLASTAAIFTEKAYAAPAASSPAPFSGTVNGSCTVSSPFPASTYTPSGPLGPSGGRTKIAKNAQASFDCNSDTVSIGTDITLTQPVPVNATSIKGVHQLDLDDQTNNDSSIIQKISSLPGGDGPSGPVTAATNTDGDISLLVRSQWTSPGEDLLSGNYGASVVVSVTAN